MIRSYPIAVAALALLAGSGGYITQRLMTRSEIPVAQSEPVAVLEAEVEVPDGGPLAWSFQAADGSRHRLDEWRGPATVVNFWATWCPPCLREIPAFVELQTRFADHGLQFIGIALDQPAAVSEFQRHHEVNYPLLVGNEDVIRLMRSLGNTIGGLPFTVVLDAAGEVVFSHQGEWAPEEAELILREILNAP